MFRPPGKGPTPGYSQHPEHPVVSRGPGPFISISSCPGSPVAEMQDCSSLDSWGHKGSRIVQVQGGERSRLRSCFRGHVGQGWHCGGDYDASRSQDFGRRQDLCQSGGWSRNGRGRGGLGRGRWG